MSSVPISAKIPLNQVTAFNGQQGVEFDFWVGEAEDFQFYIDGVLQELDVDYTVPASALRNDNGGSIDLVVPLDGGEALTITRFTVVKRDSGFTEGGGGSFRGSAINGDFARVYAILQEHELSLSRSFRLAPSEEFGGTLTMPERVAGRALVWNNTLDGIVNSSIAIDGLLGGAEAARDAARLWAVEDEDVLVNDGTNPTGFSAYHWAQVAAYYGGQVVGSVPTATESVEGSVELATEAEMNSGSAAHVPTAERVKDYVDSEIDGVETSLDAVNDAVSELVLSDTVVTAQPNIVFTGLDGSYDRYELDLTSIELSVNDSELRLYASTDNGATWLAASYSFNGMIIGSGTVSGFSNSSQSRIPLTDTTAGRRPNTSPWDTRISITTPDETSSSKNVNVESHYIDASSGIRLVWLDGRYVGGGAAHNAFMIEPASGTISAKVRVRARRGA